MRINDSQDAVLVLADQYEQLKRCVDFAEADHKALYPLVSDVSPEAWEGLSAYPNAEKL